MKNAGHYPLKAPKTLYPEFSDRLRLVMNVRQCTVQDLAAKIYISESTISMYRNGRRSPHIDVLYLIAKELQVSSDFLIGLTDTIYV